eukprot:TRINITY_DN21291_c0_g1_i1.p1 TRINITY_DN21291_c0_g1~~TRINITY_DN21291_c0_g1_i1.p1  ORF type:complete len:164 (+),score=37.09 TRINITY_DN21291_c0_g1_i1:168-659(+)
MGHLTKMVRSEKISTDYLVVGAGAMGLAFADEIINMSAGTGNDDTKIVIVDRRAKPGGHWNDAYDFVRLHQPAYYYGVSSMPLGSNYEDLVSKPQLLAYFELALQKMVDTGRVTFLGQCDYKDGKIKSSWTMTWSMRLLSGRRLWMPHTLTPVFLQPILPSIK